MLLPSVGLCQKQQKKLLVVVQQAWDLGMMILVPFCLWTALCSKIVIHLRVWSATAWNFIVIFFHIYVLFIPTFNYQATIEYVKWLNFWLHTVSLPLFLQKQAGQFVRNGKS